MCHTTCIRYRLLRHAGAHAWFAPARVRRRDMAALAVWRAAARRRRAPSANRGMTRFYNTASFACAGHTVASRVHRVSHD